MRTLQMSPSGDFDPLLPLLVNSPACVGQTVLTRLRLWLGDWFLDTSDGTPWMRILGKPNGVSPDIYIKQRILATPGVSGIVSYTGVNNASTRSYTVTATISTIYSVGGVNTTTISTSVPGG